jgi:hypothetical protein
MKAYCLRCKAMVDMEPKSEKILKNGAKMVMGVGSCGHKVSKIVKNK